MFIFTNSQGANEMFNVLPTDHWELRCTHDTIYLLINDTVYPMYLANELYRVYPELDSILVAELYDDVIGAAIGCLKRGEPWIDISDLYEEKLEQHRARWRRDGDIPD